MDFLLRVFMFTVGCIVTVFGIGAFVVSIKSAMDRYFPSPCPLIEGLVGLLLLIVCVPTGAVLILVSVGAL